MFGRNMYAVLDRKGQEQLKVELGPPRDEQKAAKSFTDWMNDNEVAYYLSMEHGFSESAEVDWMRNQNSKGEDRVWLVYVQDELIGSVGLHRIDATGWQRWVYHLATRSGGARGLPLLPKFWSQTLHSATLWPEGFIRSSFGSLKAMEAARRRSSGSDIERSVSEKPIFGGTVAG